MVPTKELIGKLLSGCQSETQASIAKYLSDELARLNNIQQAIVSANRLKMTAKEEYEKRIEKANQDIRDVQSRCKHEETRYYGDPSGGRDSHRECAICGKSPM